MLISEGGCYELRLPSDSWVDIEAARDAVEAEPFRETGHQLLMRAHAAAGNTAEALRAYERCRRLVADELGVDPSPATRTVYEQILASV